MSINMTDEIIDLVDENDVVIGDTTRGEAHKDPSLIHREVGIIIINESREILFSKRAKTKSYPGCWLSGCGGHVEKGESPLDAATREQKEELGTSIPLELLTKDFDREIDQTHFVYWYIGRYNGETFNPDSREMEAIKFFSYTELKAIVEDDPDFDLENTHGMRNKISLKIYKICKRIWEGEFDNMEKL
jgi:isopentenyldiphosphate isomerase